MKFAAILRYYYWRHRKNLLKQLCRVSNCKFVGFSIFLTIKLQTCYTKTQKMFHKFQVCGLKYLLQRKAALLFRELLVKISSNITLMKYALPWKSHFLFYKHRSRALKVGEIGRVYFAFGGNCGGTHSLSLFPYKPSTMNRSTPIFVSHTIVGLKIATDYPLDVIWSDEQWWLCVSAVRKEEERAPHHPTPCPPTHKNPPT